MTAQPVTPGDPVRIGVTGHRFLTEMDKLTAAVEQALSLIAASHPRRPLCVLSSLAEGADRLVAHAVLRREGGCLLVPLPLAPDDYRVDFGSETSRREFAELLARATETVPLPQAPSRAEAYEKAGNYVADHADVLIALWDGQDAQGRGGTADVVARALARGIPVYHIKTGNRRPGANEPTSLGEEQGGLALLGGPASE